MSALKLPFKLPKVKGKGLKFLKLLHLAGVFAWAGGCVAAFALLMHVNSRPDAAGMIYFLDAMEIVDYYAICVGAIFTMYLGLFYGVFTNWGFVKFRWLILKWIFSVTIIVTGSCFFVQGLDIMRGVIRSVGMQQRRMRSINQQCKTSTCCCAFISR